MRLQPTKPRLAMAVGAIAVVAIACTQIPVPLPFQVPLQATPGAQSTPGAGSPEKPQGQAQGQAPGKPGGAGVPVVTVPVATGKIAQPLSFSGNITPVQQTNLVPKTAGRIEKITVDVGDQVKAGQMLVQLDHGALDAAVSQAQANLESAKARLATVQTGARPEDIATANAQLASAKARLAGLEAGGRPEDISNAQAALDSARAKLAQVQQGSKDADVRAAEQGVQAAQASFDAAVANYNKLSTPSPEELASAKATVDKTQAALQTAQAAYDKVSWRPDIALRAESVALANATADYNNALAQLKLKQQPRAEDLETGKKQMDATRAQLDAAKAKLDQLKAGATPEDLQVAQATVTQAEQALAKARAPSLPTDIEQQRQSVVQAEQNVALKSQPFTANDVATAQAAVAQAQAALDNAKVAALEGAILAPYDGVVIARPLAEGALTNAATTALTIASSQVEMVVNVEESRIGLLKTGQPATITLAAYPGKVFPAKVAAIAPAADARTHTFPVKIRPDPLAPQLLSGMFAEAQVIVAEKDNIVVVPKDAVVQRSGKSVIFVVENGRARQVEIGNGLSDDKSVEIPAGLKAGDQVIVQGQATVNNNDAVRTGGQAAQGGQGGAPGKPQGGQGAAAKPEGAQGSAKPEGAQGGTKPEGAARPGAEPATSPTPSR